MKKFKLLCLGMLLVGAIMAIGCSQAGPASNVSLERQREYANELYNQQLYRQSAAEYQKILDFYPIDQELSANLNYTVGNIYFEKIGDYPTALAYFLKVKHLYKESTLVDDAKRKAVASLERMGNSVSAAALLSIGSDLKLEHLPGDTVAVIGDDYVSSGDLDRMVTFYLSGQPAETRPANNKDTKLQYLSEYLKREVLYNAARRRALDEDDEVKEVLFAQKKMIMIDKLLQLEASSSAQPTDAELRAFYNASKDKLTTTDANGKTKKLSFEEAKETVLQLVTMQKSSQLQGALIDKLIEEQNAKIYVNKVK